MLAVVIIDSQEAPTDESEEEMPAAPGLGDADVRIPVVMVNAGQGEALSAALSDDPTTATAAIHLADAEVREDPSMRI